MLVYWRVHLAFNPKTTTFRGDHVPGSPAKSLLESQDRHISQQNVVIQEVRASKYQDPGDGRGPRGLLNMKHSKLAFLLECKNIQTYNLLMMFMYSTHDTNM